MDLEPALKRLKTCSESEFPIADWDIERVSVFLEDNGFSDEIPIFIDQQIDGRALIMIDSEDVLEKMGVEPMGRRLSLLSKLQEQKITKVPCNTLEHKVFMDPIHGHMEFHPLCVKIIDTPQFQRLRYIKQLGGCYYVFPGASHNRFEHSLGVCHLAGRLVRKIQHRQPELNISDVDLLSVMIAGLCHDLGHGPFSHMFDGNFIPKARPDIKWRHEEASVDMFDYMMKINKLEPAFRQYGLDSQDIIFIKEQIAGPRSVGGINKGRNEDKHFLYEVVANKRNGIDVDKWDYFARDCHHLGITNGFDHIRFMTFARVLEVGPQKQICSRDKEVMDLYDMFHTRFMLHQRVYQHKNKNIFEEMLTEALLKADKYLLTQGSNGKMYSISETIDDMEAYCKLSDNIIHRIQFSTEPELEPSRQIIQQIECRKLYKCVGTTKPKKGKQYEPGCIDEICKEIAECMSIQELNAPRLSPDDIVIQIVSLDYGMKDANPIDRARFYMKNNPTVPIQIRREQVSHMLPDHFRDQHIYVFSKKLDPQSLDTATKCFHRWCSHKDDLEEPKGGDATDLQMTPYKPTPMKSSVSQVADACHPRKLDL